LLLCAGLVLLALTWVFSDPPGAAPDEPANYIRAVSVGRLEILGQRSTGPSVRTPDPVGRQTNRSVGIPPGLAGSRFVVLDRH